MFLRRPFVVFYILALGSNPCSGAFHGNLRHQNRDLCADDAKDIETIREEIRVLIREDRALAPKFLRLGFHDCVGGCDGCVDLTDPENNGLHIPIDALSSTVANWKSEAISRADVWALAALTGAETTQAQEAFRLEYVGRVDCEDTGKTCQDFNGNIRDCRQDLGDFRALPSSNLATHEILDFFSENFGFSPKEVAALMGAHSIGTASQEFSGFDGPVGWDDTNYFLDADYYRKLIGGGDPTDLEDLMEASPGWTQTTIANAGDIPERVQWVRGRSQDEQLRDIIALNTDVGLCRDLKDDMVLPEGEVDCGFKNPNRCPHAASTIFWMAEYRFDETKFLQDFQSVLHKMLLNGYDQAQLTKIPELPTSNISHPRIGASQSNYSSGEKIELHFENPDSARVWIAVWPSTADPRDLQGSPEAWAWPCGNDTCTGQSLSKGNFTINVSEGSWRAYLMEDMESPYQAVAFTNPFSVGEAGLSTSRSSYKSEETATVSFSNPIGARIWIGVWPAKLDPQKLSGSPEAWAWPCGSQTCRGDSLTSGEIDFNLPDGEWRLFMMIDMYEPYASIAQTNAFVVGDFPSVSVSQERYESGEVVIAEFDNPNNDRIWMAVYPADTDPSNIDIEWSEDWAWSCGSQDCPSQSMVSGTVQLANVGPGSWRVYLMADMTWPYEALTFSQAFVVEPASQKSVASSRVGPNDFWP